MSISNEKKEEETSLIFLILIGAENENPGVGLPIEAPSFSRFLYSRVITHENIISFRGWGEHKGVYYLVTEYLDKNLHKYVLEQNDDDNIGLSSRITWEVAKQIMQAMLYLHSLEKAIVHADLKPDNILVCKLILQ